MKKTPVIPAAKTALAVKAGKAVLEQLPADRKKLRLAAALLEKENLRRLGVTVAAGAAALGLVGTAMQAGLTRAALRRELKRQLAPLNRRLEELEDQNRELQRQNEQLRRELKGRG